jgi:hypothetical protein
MKINDLQVDKTSVCEFRAPMGEWSVASDQWSEGKTSVLNATLLINNGLTGG